MSLHMPTLLHMWSDKKGGCFVKVAEEQASMPTALALDLGYACMVLPSEHLNLALKMTLCSTVGNNLRRRLAGSMA